MKKKKPFVNSLRLGLIVLAVLIIYAYGFDVTQVSLKEINSPRRQESLTRVLRALAQPEIIEYDQEETFVSVPIRVPCPDNGYTPPDPDRSGAYLVVTPACADPRAEVQIEGFNFEANKRGPLSFIPVSQVTLSIGQYEANIEGYFKVLVKLPNRPDEAEQLIRTTARRPVGSPRLTQTAHDTWDKIIETVFLALLATTFGVILAVPVSFIAARNIMKDINSSLSRLALAMISWPAGIWLGGLAGRWIGEQSKLLTENLILSLGSLAIGGIFIFFITRWAFPEEEKPVTIWGRLGRAAGLFLAALIGILVLFLLATLLVQVGLSLSKSLGGFGFFGTFVNNLGQILALLITGIAALLGGSALSSLTGRLEQVLIENIRGTARPGINILLGIAAGSTLFSLLGLGVNWLYQINDPSSYLYWPMSIGAFLGGLIAVITRQRDILPVGLVVYSITRTLLNGLRAIEALIMAIVFAVWVGIGPFAGVLALSLHTIAALAKLYSEQVESIMPGPLEAIRATGANRLQTIMYAVIPQIIPPYISFTMYRWDINVRMSTIIGFAGGGGIGFLLQQNINLLNYRAASAQMVAIAIVVSVMDYVSSYMRERVV